MGHLSFKRHRFSPDVITSSTWLYARFTLSLRDIEEMFAERGLDVSYETVRRCFLKFGSMIAANLKRARPKPSDPLASRRNGGRHRWTALLALACSRQRGRSLGLRRPAKPGRKGRRKAAQEAPQAARNTPN
jgi:hypothetical protein